MQARMIAAILTFAPNQASLLLRDFSSQFLSLLIFYSNHKIDCNRPNCILRIRQETPLITRHPSLNCPLNIRLAANICEAIHLYGDSYFLNKYGCSGNGDSKFFFRINMNDYTSIFPYFLALLYN